MKHRLFSQHVCAWKTTFFFSTLLFLSPLLPSLAQDITLTGELKKWHPITLTLEGPSAEEEGEINPFLDYRLNVTFTQGATTVVVPGYFAADGNAAETGATGGSKWRVHFVPRTTGTWNYAVSMRTGTDVSIDPNPNAGEPTLQDGLSGSFSIDETDKTGRDFKGKGILSYNNTPYLQFDNGEYFIKGGADSPENFLGYYEFDNTQDFGCQNNVLQDGLHRYEAHEADWQPGDPTWHNGKGKGIIGALNYLSSKGINSVYFLPMNTEGDGCEVYPWTEYGDDASERLHYDVSKLDQWDIVFNHMDALGLMLHIVTQEQENDQLLDGGSLGTQRQLYYRELMARFGYHMAITWNLGEENTNTHNQRIEFSEYISSLDPYNHLVVVHTFPNQIGNIYDDLLGYPNDSPVQTITGNSIQRDLDNDIHSQVIKWRDRSAEMGHPWVVMLDEIGPAGTGAKPDGSGNNHKEIRQEALWATLMAGGAGVEWYFGYNNPHDDLDMEDWRSRDQLWDYTTNAVQFFLQHLPFTEMAPADDLIEGNEDYVFAKAGELYAAYLFDAETAGPMSLPNGTYTLEWYNPRTGTFSNGSVTSLQGNPPYDLGLPSTEPSEDWVVLIRAEEITARPPDTPVNTAPGLQYAYFEGEWTTIPDFSSIDPIETGFVANIDLSNRQQDNNFGFLFKGFVNAPTTGTYTFFTNSDDGSQLYIGDQRIVDNDGVHAEDEQQGSITLEAGLHELSVLYFENVGQEVLTVSWTPPNESKRAINDEEFVYDSDNLLPVELSSFTGVIDGDQAMLSWETHSELNNAGFYLERSTSSEDLFTEVGFVEGAGTATTLQSYSFTDNLQSVNANTLFYRLKQVDFDGSFTYSETIELRPDGPLQVTLNPNYPNPFNPTTTLTFSLPTESQVHLAIYDTAGRLVETLIDSALPAGHHAVTYQASQDIASGTYIYQLETPAIKKTGTMLLLK
ncbi:MAG: DUF5060 domain-containing protein [Rhodothermaceae bacterium]|nr:DUF5060 domain-containing protein [Rhodothermaceae bacterium]